MARYRESLCRLCRREGEQLFLKGERCYTPKCSIERRPNQKPGMHGKSGRVKFSEYGIRLREKQKVKSMYGLTEKQFRNYFEKAERSKGITGDVLISLLERRLDNVVYRLGLASSRNQARQLVWHGHVSVNNRKVDIPSYLVKEGDVVEVVEKSKKMPPIAEALELIERRGIPEWLELDRENLKGVVKRLPERNDVTAPIEEQLIVEFYSRV